ncbi:MAG: YXWGXW repeat-containing protein [Rhodothermia bacterium]|nr:YXWGXW repeat-containing protein [Rhodothermia bacterium]
MRTLRFAAVIAAACFVAATTSSQVAEANSSPSISIDILKVHADGKLVVVRRRPPALRVEIRTRRPSRRHVWVGGHWGHRHGRYVWVKGRWVVPPRRGALYVRPVWVKRGGGYVLVRGVWR